MNWTWTILAHFVTFDDLSGSKTMSMRFPVVLLPSLGLAGGFCLLALASATVMRLALPLAFGRVPSGPGLADSISSTGWFGSAVSLHPVGPGVRTCTGLVSPQIGPSAIGGSPISP